MMREKKKSSQKQNDVCAEILSKLSNPAATLFAGNKSIRKVSEFYHGPEYFLSAAAALMISGINGKEHQT